MVLDAQQVEDLPLRLGRAAVHVLVPALVAGPRVGVHLYEDLLPVPMVPLLGRDGLDHILEAGEHHQGEEADEQAPLHHGVGVHPQPAAVGGVLQVVEEQLDVVPPAVEAQCLRRVLLGVGIQDPEAALVVDVLVDRLLPEGDAEAALGRAPDVEVPFVVALVPRRRLAGQQLGAALVQPSHQGGDGSLLARGVEVDVGPHPPKHADGARLERIDDRLPVLRGDQGVGPPDASPVLLYELAHPLDVRRHRHQELVFPFRQERYVLPAVEGPVAGDGVSHPAQLVHVLQHAPERLRVVDRAGELDEPQGGVLLHR